MTNFEEDIEALRTKARNRPAKILQYRSLWRTGLASASALILGLVGFLLGAPPAFEWSCYAVGGVLGLRVIYLRHAPNARVWSDER